MSRLVNPDGLMPAVGFSYASVADKDALIHLAGITGHSSDGDLDDDLVSQFGAACRTIAVVLSEAGATPEDLVSVTIYTTEMDEYRSHLAEIGQAWRSVFGKHYPPMALIGVTELFDPKAVVELVGVAALSDGS